MRLLLRTGLYEESVTVPGVVVERWQLGECSEDAWILMKRFPWLVQTSLQSAFNRFCIEPETRGHLASVYI